MKMRKCSLAKPEVKSLGHIMSTPGTAPDTEKIEKVNSFPQPRNIKEVRQFIGLTHHPRFCTDCYSLKRQQFLSLETHTEVSIKLREKLTSPTVLAFQDFSKELTPMPLPLTKPLCYHMES